ncbi:hypothetical protein KFE25_001684 [Diacronema lutheri]|uniref:Protein root UVB sensitive/RUS domain-containing protein n=1 Tax=Diacronema lutheri TaxID=2081491 RepID=A0A8J5X7I9_DIALT|nr:hypothetical protein KFE25_001684 [Diacronema lutheri]
MQLVAPLLPRDYPASVAPEYASYAAWIMVHNALGAAAGTLSMQALLVSAGVGATAATPAAAALNWCLKDGAGQVATIASAYAVAHRFDAHPKQWRLAAGWLENGARLLEMYAPYAPALFLPLASVSAVGKAVACLAASASKAALHLSLSRAHGNLADLTAKAGAQAVVSQLVGTAAGLALSVAVTLPHPHTAPVVGALLAAGHMGTLARALRCVTLNVVDAPKADALARAYIARERLPSPPELSAMDDGLLPPLAERGASTTLVFSRPLDAIAPDAKALGALLDGARARGYVLAPCARADGGARARGLLLDGAPPSAALVAHLHAYRLALELDAGARPGDALARAHAYAAAHRRAYMEALDRAGWEVAHTLLDTGERLALVPPDGERPITPPQQPDGNGVRRD